jgi:molybdopterin molybdotransferase
MIRMIDLSTKTHPEDPRGRGFRNRVPMEFVEKLICEHVSFLASEQVPIQEADRRVLAECIIAEKPVPHFEKAAMDGFAVMSLDTLNASQTEPAHATLIGRSMPGQRFERELRQGQAVAIATGAPVPEGADAVVPVEFVSTRGEILDIRLRVTPGRHIVRIGEDVTEGQKLLDPGRVLRPQDIGILSAIGKGQVSVIRKPVIAIIVTGDELLPAGTPPADHAIPDTNSPMLAALVRRDGGLPAIHGPFQDHAFQLKHRIAELCSAPGIDAVFVSGGSSTGPEDHAPAIVRELGELLAHGVAIKPASPTGFGIIAGKPVLLMPGNPASCLCAYDFFGFRIVKRLAGRVDVNCYPVVRKRTLNEIVSALSRVDYVRVRFTESDKIEPIVHAGASNLFATVTADGFIIIPADMEVLPAGSFVDVHLYDSP